MRTVPDWVWQLLTLQGCLWGHLCVYSIGDSAFLVTKIMVNWCSGTVRDSSVTALVLLKALRNDPLSYSLQGPGITGDWLDLKSFPKGILEAMWTWMNLKDRQRILWLPWKLRPESRMCVREEIGVGQVKTRAVTSPGLSLDYLQQIKQEMHEWENSNTNRAPHFFNADCEAFLLTVNTTWEQDDCMPKKQSRTTFETVREGFPPSHRAQGSWLLSIIACTW